jgi:hypothetical protein
MHLLVHVEAISGGARLAHIAHLGDHGAVDRGIDVGIIEHDKGRIAAELHRWLDDVVGGFVQKLTANLSGTSERHHAHARIVQHGADYFAG